MTPIETLLALAQDVETLERESEIMLSKLGELEAELNGLFDENDVLKYENEMLSSEVELMRSQNGSKESSVDKMIAWGVQYIGTPYLMGSSPFNDKTFDCSDLVQHMYSQIGVRLPRTARAQDSAEVGMLVNYDELQRGDLIFFDADPNRLAADVADHVGMYIGNGLMIHTVPRTGVDVVEVRDWRKYLIRCRRVLVN